MIKYSQFRPTGFDRAGAFLPDQQDWIVAPVSQNRDSGPLQESNFACFLESLGGEQSGIVEVHRFGHWGNGWFEIILINPDHNEIVARAEALESSLESYPVLNEQDYSRREWNCYVESWDTYGRREYLKELRKEIFTHFADGVSGDFTDGEIEEAIDELPDSVIDELRHDAAQKANWEYEPDGDGVTINIKGLAEKTDMDRLADLAIEYCHDAAQKRDITKLAVALGATPEQVKTAVEKRLVMVSQIRALVGA